MNKQDERKQFEEKFIGVIQERNRNVVRQSPQLLKKEIKQVTRVQLALEVIIISLISFCLGMIAWLGSELTWKFWKD